MENKRKLCHILIGLISLLFFIATEELLFSIWLIVLYLAALRELGEG